MVDAFQALMADIVNKATRSRMMRGIRGKNTQPELRLRRAIRALGRGYRLKAECLPYRPDLVFLRKKIAVFVHGCYWHRHEGCRNSTMPASNYEYWRKRFEENIARDIRVVGELRSLGWRVATIWECALRNEEQGCTAAIELEEWSRTSHAILEIGAKGLAAGL